MERQPINLTDKLSRFAEHWSPRIIAQMYDYHFKLPLPRTATGRARGRDARHSEGQAHKTSESAEPTAMLVERAGTVNTGGVASDRTAAEAWI